LLRRLIAIVAVLVTAFVVVPVSAEAARFGSRVLKVGSQGNDVRLLQEKLTFVGFSTTADGVFGRGTESVVRAWEADSALRVNGRVNARDARTLKSQVKALRAAEAEAPETEAAEDTLSTPSSGGASYVAIQKATLNRDGTATPPPNAPAAVKAVIEAGNEIAKKPYKYGGGHGTWTDSGYDCSGSVSYALHFGGLLKASMPSGGFETYGDPGPGQWITTYANGGHMYMVVAGLRFDTSAAKAQANRSRWTTEMRSPAGFVARHPRGY
jgi:peptidoglycan hydrolase-like protein with peptidoglycan-binding domain